MGCSNQKQEIPNIPTKKKLYEAYSEVNPDNFNINFYKLNWKVENIICYFQLIEQEVHLKKDITDFLILLDKTKIMEIKDIEFDFDIKNFLYYVYMKEGVFITRNYKKVNYFMKNYMNKLIKIDFIHISEEFFQKSEVFSIHEIKRQTKYFFDLNQKEIDFTDRKKLIEEAKNNVLSDNEIELNDESFDENKNNIDNDNDNSFENQSNDDEENIINKNQSMKNINFKIPISLNKKNTKNDIKPEDNNSHYKAIDLVLKEKEKKDNNDNNISSSNYGINSINLKNKIKKYNSMDNKIINEDKIENIKYKLERKNNIKNLFIKNKENQIFDTKNEDKINNNTHMLETDGEEEDKNNEKNDKNNKINNTNTQFKITNKNTMIISANELNENINKQLETFFYSFCLSNNTTSSIDHINFYNKDEDISLINNKSNDNNDGNQVNDKNKEDNNDLNNNIKKEPNDYILIYSNERIPYEKRICLEDIENVFFTNCDFNIKSIYYLKQLMGMLMRYKNLKKVGIYFNKMDRNFIGWKFFKNLFKENFNIRWVSFKGAYLDDKVFMSIASGLMLRRIRYLNISKNNLSNSCMYFLNQLLLKNQTLIHLDLSDNKHISLKGIKFIFNGIKFHSNLTDLILNNINLNACGKLIVELLRVNKNLKKLCIRNGNFDVKDLKEIINEISKRECLLTYLDISSNKTPGDECLKDISRLISHNISLKHLGLDDLNLNLDNYLPIFQAIFKNRGIESYSLNLNKGLPFKGTLNFFLKNPQVKMFSFIPWDREKEPKKNFTREQINLLQRFHSRAPEVKIVGFDLKLRKSLKYSMK